MSKNNKGWAPHLVSRVEEIKEDVSGGTYQALFLSLSNILTSNNWEVKKAAPEAKAILKLIKFIVSIEKKIEIKFRA